MLAIVILLAAARQMLLSREGHLCPPESFSLAAACCFGSPLSMSCQTWAGAALTRRIHYPQTACCSNAPALIPFTVCTCLFPWHGLQGAGEHCVLAASAEEPGKYTLILCNAIGMPLSTKQIPLEPVLLAMTPEHLVVASPDTVFMWRYDAEGASSSELPRGWQRRSKGGG